VRLIRTILELDRCGVRGALSGSCPLLGTGVDRREDCARHLLAKLSTEEWPAMAQRVRESRS
jgi:hypothetical protein